MPVALRIGSYLFLFWSVDGRERPHIHVEHTGRSAKFWLLPVALAKNGGYRNHELKKIKRMVEDNRDLLLQKWYEHFGGEN